ncbi:hypothetical protein [Haloarcula sediminis]|uniref:hypothetical protein n=1 Tax=Haloarcula sediminis TaxID=3111777 RepID=UPI002D78E37D|nr:hypothetical protein [Haloarcula sp. CK38]
MWDSEADDESEEESGWYYVGHGSINHSANRIQFPEGIFEAGILDRGGDAYWSYERVVGTLITSNRELTEEENYNCVGSRAIGGGEDNHRGGIPAPFFADYGGNTKRDSERVPEKAQIRNGEERHFVYREGMDEGETRSCYLLTGDQIVNRLRGPGDWKGQFDSAPQFF